MQHGESISLLFTIIFDEIRLSLVDEGEELREWIDCVYWEARGSKAPVAMIDEILKLVAEFVVCNLNPMHLY